MIILASWDSRYTQDIFYPLPIPTDETKKRKKIVVVEITSRENGVIEGGRSSGI